MPNKYPDKKVWSVPKQKYKISNWSEDTEALRQRGNITLWLSDEAISEWYELDGVYDGTVAPKNNIAENASKPSSRLNFVTEDTAQA